MTIFGIVVAGCLWAILWGVLAWVWAQRVLRREAQERRERQERAEAELVERKAPPPLSPPIQVVIGEAGKRTPAGTVFTKDALLNMAHSATQTKLPVYAHPDSTRLQDVVGMADHVMLLQDQLCAQVSLFEGPILGALAPRLCRNMLDVVPEGVIEESHQEGEVTVYDRIRLTGLSLGISNFYPLPSEVPDES